MKVAISARGNTPDSLVHRQFGRCDWFLILEEGKKGLKAMGNSYAQVQTGAGIGCAQDLIREGVKAVISGQVGPRAYEVLNQAGIEIYLAPSEMSVQEAYQKFVAGGLEKMEIKRF